MKIYLLNYSDDRHGHKQGRFRQNQLAHNEAARRQGIENIVSWTWDDLAKTSFHAEHADYLAKNRFHNGAVFKPFITLDLLERIEPGDVLFYYDCNPYPLERSLQPLVDLCLQNGGTCFHQYGDKNRQWTKRDAFFYMDCDTPQYHNAVALQNTWFLLQKNPANLQFVREWLRHNLDERIASYVKPDTCGRPPLKGFLENRGDQAIFSNLAVKYGIKSFYGLGGTRNRNVNQFIAALPRNKRDAAKLFLKQTWIKLKRRKFVLTAKPEDLIGVIPPELRKPY